MIGETWGIRRPFEVAFVSFLIATAYVRVAMPFIPPNALSDPSTQNSKGHTGFFAPLRVLVPQKVLLANGTVARHYGVIFLCVGVFLGVVCSFD